MAPGSIGNLLFMSCASAVEVFMQTTLARYAWAEDVGALALTAAVFYNRPGTKAIFKSGIFNHWGHRASRAKALNLDLLSAAHIVKGCWQR